MALCKEKPLRIDMISSQKINTKQYKRSSWGQTTIVDNMQTTFENYF